MSTDRAGRRAQARRRRGRIFLGTFAAVLGVLAVLGLAGAAVSNTQGPRATSVQVDPRAAVEASGSRLIVTTNQSLEKLKTEQVEVTPATPFTIDTSGRSAGVRFTLPLHDDTAYTVRLKDVAGLGGGPATTITESFRTPSLSVYFLRRGGDGDTIYRSGLGDAAPTAVFHNDHIEDFRVTSSHIVVSVLDSDQKGHLLVTDLDGTHQRALKLPGDGQVSELQSADRGELIGYTWSDASLGEGTGREAALFTASLKDSAKDAKPTPVAVAGSDKRVADWHFVPDTDSILVLTFDGRLLLSGASGSDAADLGTGMAIDGIARGSSVAVVQRVDGMVTIDLTNGKEAPLPDATVGGQPLDGVPGIVTPIPGIKAGSVRLNSVVDDEGIAQGTTVYRVTDAGAATPIFVAPGSDAVLQTCVSPSARYAAVLVAPDVVSNPYDTYVMPMPKKTVTHVIDLASGKDVRQFDGFDISWCQVPPPASQ
jgi:hypothetical protein